MQDRPNEYALEYKLGSEDERQFLVFTTTDFRLVLSTADYSIKSRNGLYRTISMPSKRHPLGKTWKSNTFSEKLIELKGNLEIGTLHIDDLKSKTKVKKRTKSFDRISSSHRSSINIDL